MMRMSSKPRKIRHELNKNENNNNKRLNSTNKATFIGIFSQNTIASSCSETATHAHDP
ncbi:hypothetical protein ACHAXS_003306 [Conticribra weissflogii]